MFEYDTNSLMTGFPQSHKSEIPVLFQSKIKHFPVLFASWQALP